MTDYSKEQYALLDDDDKDAIDTMLSAAIDALSTGKGTVLLMADTNGDGNAVMLAAGNQLLIEPMLRSAGLVGEQVFSNTSGVLQ
jgi:hypothetical protein